MAAPPFVSAPPEGVMLSGLPLPVRTYSDSEIVLMVFGIVYFFRFKRRDSRPNYGRPTTQISRAPSSPPTSRRRRNLAKNLLDTGKCCATRTIDSAPAGSLPSCIPDLFNVGLQTDERTAREQLRSARGRKRAFSTCASSLLIGLTYWTCKAMIS